MVNIGARKSAKDSFDRLSWPRVTGQLMDLFEEGEARKQLPKTRGSFPAQEKKFLGWQLRQIHPDSAAEKDREPKKYPFTLDSVLPWWGRKPAI
jgi:hypothetical protein